MKLLLDTCAFLWSANDASKLSSAARNAVTNNENEVFVSSISGWEILLKQQRTPRLKLASGVSEFVERAIRLLELEELPFSLACLSYVERLPAYHQDPFDRLLIGQALHAGCTLVTPDAHIHRYPVPVLW